MLKLLARAKINWTLDITGRRADGYHLMDMLMQSVTLADEITLEKTLDGEITLTTGGTPLLPADEHHLALMYNMKISVAYLPKTKVIGLSKVARIADMVCKRLQLQERITSDIAQIMQLVLGTEDVLVHIEGEHSCMTARGIRKPGTVTTTTVSCGAFKTDAALRTEVFSQL